MLGIGMAKCVILKNELPFSELLRKFYKNDFHIKRMTKLTAAHKFIMSGIYVGMKVLFSF